MEACFPRHAIQTAPNDLEIQTGAEWRALARTRHRYRNAARGREKMSDDASSSSIG
jgi:hypothetical protein